MATREDAIREWLPLANDTDPTIRAEADAMLAKLGATQAPMAKGVRPAQPAQPGPYASAYSLPVNGVLDTTPAVAKPAGREVPPDPKTGLIPGPSALDNLAFALKPGVPSFAEGALPGITDAAHLLAVPVGAAPPMRQGADGHWVPGIDMEAAEKARRARREDARAAHDESPAMAAGAGLLGSAIGLPGVVAGGVAGALKAVPWLGTPAKGIVDAALKGPIRGVATYEATAPAQAAISDPNEVGGAQAFKDAATDPLGILLSGVLGYAGARAERRVTRLNDPKTLAGRTIRDVADAGGTINKVGDEPVAGGIYETPAMKGLPEGREGVNKVAGRSGKVFTRYNRAKLAKERSYFEQEENDIVASQGNRGVLPENTLGRIDELQRANVVNGKVQDKALQGVLDHYKDTFGVTEDGAATVQPTVKATELIGMKKLIADKAEFDMPRTAENRPYRLLYNAIAKDAESIDPKRLAALNKRFSSTVSELERANDIMYGKNTADIPDRAAAERTAEANFGRAGDPTQAGTLRADQLEELVAIDPVYRTLLRRVKAKKAQENLRYGDDGQVLDAPSARGSGGALGLLGLTPRNRGIAEIRLGLPAAEQTLKLTPPAIVGAAAGRRILPGFIPEIEQAIEDGRAKRQDRERNQ